MAIQVPMRVAAKIIGNILNQWIIYLYISCFKNSAPFPLIMMNIFSITAPLTARPLIT